MEEIIAKKEDDWYAVELPASFSPGLIVSPENLVNVERPDLTDWWNANSSLHGDDVETALLPGLFDTMARVAPGQTIFTLRGMRLVVAGMENPDAAQNRIKVFELAAISRGLEPNNFIFVFAE